MGTASTGATYDMGATNTYRYVNATNVYSKGKSMSSITSLKSDTGRTPGSNSATYATSSYTITSSDVSTYKWIGVCFSIAGASGRSYASISSISIPGTYVTLSSQYVSQNPGNGDVSVESRIHIITSFSANMVISIKYRGVYSFQVLGIK
jgi:hypothetical protein